MIRPATVALALTLLAGCGSGPAREPVPIPAEGPWQGRGILAQSIPCDTPVVIRANSTQRGIAAEHAFIRKHYPGFRMSGQALRFLGDRPYDELTIGSTDGTQFTVCFEISSFFGSSYGAP